MILAATVLVFVVLLVLSLPIVFCLGIAGVTGLWLGGYPMQQLGSSLIAASQSWVLLAIPSFVFAGSLMERAGMSHSLVELARALVGWLRGGLGMSVIVVSYFFSDICGSKMAEVSALSSALMPKPLARAGAGVTALNLLRDSVRSTEFVRLPLPLLRVGRERFFERNIWPEFRVFRIQRHPSLNPFFGVRLDRVDRAFRLADPAIDAFVGVDDEHVLALVKAVHRAHLDAGHDFAPNAALVDDIGQLSILSADRGGDHSQCPSSRRLSSVENGRRGDRRRPALSVRRTVGIRGPSGSRSSSRSTFLHRGTRSPCKHRSADAPHSQPTWSARGAKRRASRFAFAR